MKVDVKSKQREFESIEVTITIESKDELIDLFNRSRITTEDIYRTFVDKNYVDIDYPSSKIDTSKNMILYGKLHTLMKKLNKHSQG